MFKPKCWCWTSETNKYRVVVHNLPVAHAKDCPYRCPYDDGEVYCFLERDTHGEDHQAWEPVHYVN